MAKTITIIKGSKARVSKHFTQHELRCRSNDAPASFLIDAALIDMLEYLRVLFGIPILISSTGRTINHQYELVEGGKSGAMNSQHTILPAGIVRAVDFSFGAGNQANILRLRDAMEKENHIWYALREMGLKGIGFYDTFIHIDTRLANGLQVDDLGKYAFWNYQVALKKKSYKSFSTSKVTLS